MNKHDDTSNTGQHTHITSEQQGSMETQSIDTESMQDTSIINSSIATSPVLCPDKPYITDEDFTNYKDMVSGAVNALTLAILEKFQALESEVLVNDEGPKCCLYGHLSPQNHALKANRGFTFTKVSGCIRSNKESILGT